MTIPAARQPTKKPRGPGRPFVKGQAANPRGRIPGSKNRVTLVAEAIMEAGAEEITSAVVAAAGRGDMTAARIVLDRIAPPRKGRTVVFPLPAIETSADVVSAIGAVAVAMADGTLTPDEAQVVGSVIELKRRAIETADLEVRLAALEAKEAQ